MESYKHLILSAIIGLPVTIYITGTLSIPFYLFAVACGTLIDADHFLWIWKNHGFSAFIHDTWAGVKHLKTTMTDNEKVIHQNKVGLTSKQRYISHLLILSIAPFVFFFIGKQVSYNTGAFGFQISMLMFSTHIAEDIYADWRNGRFS